MNATSLGFKVCVFLAASPDEALSTRDVVAKFDVVDQQKIAARLAAHIREGWIACARGTRGHKARLNVYSAGPELLKFIGRAPT